MKARSSSAASHPSSGVQKTNAGGQPIAGRRSLDDQRFAAGETAGGGGRARVESQVGAAPSLYQQLRVWAEMYEDVMNARVAICNRLDLKADGKQSKANVTVDPTPYLSALETLKIAERGVALALKRSYRLVADPSIIAWQKSVPGVGEHLLARLLGTIGHPRHTTAHHWEGDGKGERVLVGDGPMERRVSDLWSYCGHGDAMRQRRHGMNKDDAAALGSWRAKMLTRLIAKSVLKAQGGTKRLTIGPEAAIYYARRAHTADREGWTDGHADSDAARILGKELLKQLWLAAGEGRGE